MPQFSDFILEILRPWRSVTASRMFGGHGVYHVGGMFALIVDGQLYLKFDDESWPASGPSGADRLLCRRTCSKRPRKRLCLALCADPEANSDFGGR